MNRREFLGTAGIASFGASAGMGAQETIAIITDPGDQIAASEAVAWAATRLEQAIAAKGMTPRRCSSAEEAKGARFAAFIAGPGAPVAGSWAGGTTLPAEPEAFTLVPGRATGQRALLACGRDPRGLVYAILELADRVEHGAAPDVSLNIAQAVVERPANRVRSIARLFVNDLEDKPWFNDRDMWPSYLDLLAAQRFNRFNLSFGIGYDFLRQVTDAYFLFLYPFLLDVPGHKVRAAPLPDSERDRNLQMLKFIAKETVRRGIDFQLGIWTHGYEWENSPNPNYTIEGLTAENHAAYCRDAVRLLLKEVPDISGITFRVHGESGVEEGSYDFWRTVFSGVESCGRKVEIDMHAKGMNDTMLRLATDTGLPVKVSPKYWAEHMGMPYHQADIRQQEVPRPDREVSSLMKFSAGSRSFLRYGYGDLLKEDRPWGILHRIWPGTQRLLLWGDPVTAAAHARAFTFCGTDGVEIMEPLSFKGRRGSGYAGNRTAYADSTLRPRWDWQKYEYSYRVWGQALYNPESEPHGPRRYLEAQFGDKARTAEAAISNASRILPIITTAHGASAANNTYWPEVYTNQPIVDAGRPHPYRDTPAPRTFGSVSPFDPQLFARINDFADELIRGERTGKYSPIEVAQWLENYSADASGALANLHAPRSPEQRRLVEDVAIQAGIGRFFAAKMRAGVLYSIFERTGDRGALTEAIRMYRQARSAWAQFAERARTVYVADITVGERDELRGHWLDRLPAIEQDIADMEKKLESAGSDDLAKPAVAAALGKPQRGSVPVRHTPPSPFVPAKALELEFSCSEPVSAVLHYRHVTHAERWESIPMESRDNRHRAVVPASYMETEYPFAYYFELRTAPDKAWLYPGFNAELTNQPYFVVRRA